VIQITEEIDYNIDPELVDDRETHDEDVEPIELPDYDHSQFELPDDFEYTEEDGDEDGSD